MSHKHSKGLPFCQNCSTPISEMDKFCPNCGQKNTDVHVSMHDLWHELTHYFTHVDNKIFITIRDLFIPGKLTEAFFKGYRKRYIHPINLFFVVGVVVPLIMGQIWKKTKVSSVSSLFSKDKELYRNDLLFEMDSMVKRDTALYTKEVKKALHTFLLKNYQRSNTSFMVSDTTELGYQIKYLTNIDKLRDARQAIVLLNSYSPLEMANKDNQLIKQRLQEFQNRYSKLQADSLTYLIKYAQLIKSPLIEASKKLDLASMGYYMGKGMALKGIKIKKLTLGHL